MINSLESLPPSSDVFIDANIFLYHIMKRPKFFPACNAFLERMESGSYNGFTSTLVLNEMLHKLIVAEDAKIYGLRSEQDAVNVLKREPEKISELSQVWKNYADLKDYPIIINSFNEASLDVAVDLSKKHGLLISDASHLAVMKAQGITNIATNDSDFERANGINIYKP